MLQTLISHGLSFFVLQKIMHPQKQQILGRSLCSGKVFIILFSDFTNETSWTKIQIASSEFVQIQVSDFKIFKFSPFVPKLFITFFHPCTFWHSISVAFSTKYPWLGWSFKIQSVVVSTKKWKLIYGIYMEIYIFIERYLNAYLHASFVFGTHCYR